MDGTGKNVKMKRKSHQPEKKREPKSWHESSQIHVRVSGGRLRVTYWGRDTRREARKSVLIPGKALGDAGGDRYLELLMLICLHHQQDPENERGQANEAVQCGSEPERAISAHHHETHTKEKDPNDDIKDVETAEHDDRLRRVKTHERPLVDQEENDSREPSKQVAQERGHVFRQPGLRALRGWHHGSSRLRFSAFGTERRASRNFSAALAAKGHCVSPFWKS
jgi:hypothetical protein